VRLTINLLLVCGLLAAVPSLAAADPQATAVPGLTNAGEAILQGADGAMWVAEPADPGAIARVTVAGAVTEFKGGVTSNFNANRRPSGLAITPEGTVWPVGTMWFLMTGGGDEFGRITTSGAVGRYALNDGRPTSLVGGPDGRLWMTVKADSGDPDAIVRMNTTDTTITTFTAGLSSSSNPRSITVGPDGALWFVEDGGSGRIGRITTAGVLTWQNVGGAPATIAAGPLASLWLARGATVTRLNDLAAFSTGSAASALATGPDGALWAAMVGAVARIEPGGATNVYTAGVPSGAHGLGLAAGADGRMWMTLDRSPYLVRITVPPLVGTAQALADAPTTGTISADVTPNGLETTVTAQVAQPDGTWQTVGGVSLPAGTAVVPVTLALTGLAPGTSRRLRVTATNAAGTATTAGVELVTPALPVVAPPVAPIAPPVAPPVATAVPVQGKNVVLEAGAGTVRVKVPGQAGYVTLDGTSNVPVGSLIDTTTGSVVLSSRIGAVTQSGTFHGGKFRVKQLASGMTELALAGALDCRPITTSRHLAASKPKPRRRVWGADSGGQYQTHGSSSVATVRGTRWYTEDTCAGTRVRVTQGTVSVKATGKHAGRAVLVKAGHSHFTASHR
jgi:hypothetical protein